MVQELEYVAYGFLADFDSNLLFPMPLLPKVADGFLSPPLEPDPAEDP